MVNEGVLRQKLAMLAGYLADLQDVQTDIDIQMFTCDKKTQRYTERTLHLAIECCLDIGSHLIADEGFREPLNNKDVFAVLAENRVIMMEEVAALQSMAQFRNLLVHDYARIDPVIVYHIVQNNLDDIRNYGVRIRNVFLG